VKFRANMDVSTAVAVLDAFGSENDPIFRRGKETTPYDLDGELVRDRDLQASRVRIRYNVDGRWVDGTLATMVFDRMELKVRRG
jgi:hypothetical protein